MGTATYYKLRQENKELKEKLALYENGFSGLVVEENVIKASKSFEELFRNTKKKLGNAWKKADDMCRESGITCYDGPNDYALRYIMERLVENIPNEIVNFVIGQEREKTSMTFGEWEWIKRLGEGDQSKGLDIMVLMYSKTNGKEGALRV